MRSDSLDRIGTDHGATPMHLDIAKQGDDQQPLLGRIKEMNEKVAVHMPPLQFLRVRPLACHLFGAEIHNEGVVPGGRVLRHARLASQQFADGSPGFRGKGLDRFLLVLGHMRAFGDPSGLVVRGEAESRPHVGGPFSRFFARKAARDAHPSVAHEMVDLLLGELVVWVRCHLAVFC